jgi:hypothetical protein
MDLNKIANEMIETIDNNDERIDIRKIVRYLKNYYDECINCGFSDEIAMEMMLEVQAKMIFITEE